MRASIIILYCMSISSNLIGQNTKLIVKYFQNTKQIMEEYYVLMNNENIKHGKYIRYLRTTDKDFLKEKAQYISKEGFYYQNQLDSTWIYYNTQPGWHWITKEENYKRGNRAGIWKTYIEYGAVIKRFDYDLNKEIEPEFRINASYPAIAAEKGIHGKVKVQVIYNTDCTISGIKVVQSADPELDNASINCISSFEKLRLKYSLVKDCSVKRDSTYTINFSLGE